MSEGLDGRIDYIQHVNHGNYMPPIDTPVDDLRKAVASERAENAMLKSYIKLLIQENAELAQRNTECSTMTCRHIFHSDEGTGHCTQAGVTAEQWAEMKADNEMLLATRQQFLEELEAVRAERDMLRETLADLLEDTQHADHDCNGTAEDCPAIAAREALARLKP